MWRDLTLNPEKPMERVLQCLRESGQDFAVLQHEGLRRKIASILQLHP